MRHGHCVGHSKGGVVFFLTVGPSERRRGWERKLPGRASERGVASASQSQQKRWAPGRLRSCDGGEATNHQPVVE